MLSALFPSSRSIMSERAISDPWGQWPGDDTSAVASSVKVTQDSATQLLAVYGSASLITDEIATLPVNIDGAPRPQWVDYPTDHLDRIAWLSQIVWSITMSGVAYLAVLGDPLMPSALEPLDPAKVHPERIRGGVRHIVGGVPSPWPVIQINGRMRPGDLVGMNPVEWARTSIALGLSSIKYGTEWFDGEGNMPGVIEAPSAMQPDTIRNLAAQWRQKRQRGGRGLPGVLQMGATWKPIGVTNEQAQFLATRKYTAAEIVGQMFLLDPSELGIPVEGNSLTYGNLQQRDQRRMRVALMPTIRRIESQLSQVVPGAGTYRFDVDSTLRGNTKESYETLAVGLDAGFLTVEEVRDILGLAVLQDAPEVAPDDIDE